MNEVLVGILGALLATNAPAAVSNLVKNATGISVSVPNPNDPVEKEYRRLLEDDDAAQEEVDKWIDQAEEFKKRGVDRGTLSLRIRDRLAPVRKAYEGFIERHPKHVQARVAYGSFLNDIGEDAAGAEVWEKARVLAPDDPAIWNNLANYYGHRSPVAKAFEYYARAIELNGKEPVYYWNFATTVYLFRTDAQQFYKINETQVFDKALDLYKTAVSLDPTNFVLFSDYAQSYYGTKPPRWKDGLEAWTHALTIAKDELEREGVFIHLARINLQLGNLQEAQTRLTAVTNANLADLRDILQRKLDRATGKAPPLAAKEEIGTKTETEKSPAPPARKPAD